jgi:hypothetical protein
MAQYRIRGKSLQTWSLRLSDSHRRQLSRKDLKRMSLVSKRLMAICNDKLAEVLLFPSVNPHPRRHKYKNYNQYRSDLQAVVHVRDRTLEVLRDPLRAPRVKEIHVTGEIPKSVWNQKKGILEDTDDYEHFKALQELELRELASLLSRATGLQSLR